MNERLHNEEGYDQEILIISQNLCQRIINTGREIVREQRITDEELVDLLTCGSLYPNPNQNVQIIADGGVHALAEHIEKRKTIPIGNFYLSYGGYSQAPNMNLEQVHGHILRYAKDLGFIDSPDLRTVKPKLKETPHFKRVRLKHPNMPVEMSLRLSGDLKAEGFRLDFVTG